MIALAFSCYRFSAKQAAAVVVSKGCLVGLCDQQQSQPVARRFAEHKLWLWGDGETDGRHKCLLAFSSFLTTAPKDDMHAGPAVRAVICPRCVRHMPSTYRATSVPANSFERSRRTNG